MGEAWEAVSLLHGGDARLGTCQRIPSRAKAGVFGSVFPELKADGSKFLKDDYSKLHEETRSSATMIVDGMELYRLEAGYDEHSKRRRVSLPSPVEFSLLPSPKKTSEPAESVELTPGEKDELKMDDISDVDLVEVCNGLLSPAGVVGLSS